MSQVTNKLLNQIRELPDEEKLHLVDAILTDLYKPDPDVERIWAEEARKRWEAYKAGKLSAVSYEEVMAKHRR
jgi:putative addiction module component (TIGR02574 family)